ncbi:MAG: HIT family protein [Erysipelotrichaceae bacterium]
MCLFCDIVEGKIPCYKVYEDDKVLAFLDISQVTEGHTLVIPKKHYDNYLEADDETLTQLSIVARNIGNSLMKSFKASGINILSNVNEVAGQSVKHLHIHVIPRYSNEDAIAIEFKETKQQDLNVILNKIKL